MTNHIHWEYYSAGEFDYVDRKEDEYFDTFDAAKARVQELVLNNSYDFDLQVWWYDGCTTGEPYRYFRVFSPDRG